MVELSSIVGLCLVIGVIMIIIDLAEDMVFIKEE